MCGIAGVHTLNPAAPEVLRRRVQRMAARLIHRGPDEDGFLVEPTVGLASRRLRIIDLAGGRMPIANESGSVHAVYNGEIYNFRALRAELLRRGHRFTTNSDTEVLVHLYEEEGIHLVHRLIGMFAFALWDAERETLYLVRDRLGIKPVHYRHDGSTLTFASELGALMEGQAESPEIDLHGLADYLALGYVRAPRTIYENYRKLPPASVLTSRAGQIEISSYWSPPRTPGPTPSSVDSALEELDGLLRTAVHDRLVADVPLGAFLSGGVDSSLVVALAAEGASGPLATFSVGFDGDDELPYARMVADRYGTDHHELVLGPSDCQILDRLIDAFGEPFGDDSAIPTYFVSQLARTQVTVALSGDGGDELFAGYDRYLHDAAWAWIDRIPGPIRTVALGAPASLLPAGAYGVNRLRALAAGRDDRYSLHVAEELDADRGGLLQKDLRSWATPRHRLFRAEFEAAAALPYPARLQYVDTVSYLPDDILTKVDRMSMVHSLEARVPILDHRIVEFASRLPSDWRIQGRSGKWLLKRLAERYVPREVLHRPKRGFSVPINAWMRDESSQLVEELLAPTAEVRHYLEMLTVARLVREHRSARRDHSETLWRLLVLERWLSRQRNGRPV